MIKLIIFYSLIIAWLYFFSDRTLDKLVKYLEILRRIINGR